MYVQNVPFLLLLTLACIGGAEGYCNYIVCLCIFSKISEKTMNISGSNELLADFKLYKDQK